MVTSTLPLASSNADWTFPAVLFTRVGLVSAWPHNSSGTEFAWCGAEDLPPKDRAAWREYEASGEAARAAKRNYEGVQTPVIRALMDNVRDDAVKLWTPHCIPDIPSWHRGRVRLIGDAAHALPPNGQGSPMAFEDAAYLARLLGCHPLDASRDSVKSRWVFAQFERNRRPRITGRAGRRAGRLPRGSIHWRSGGWRCILRGMDMSCGMSGSRGLMLRSRRLGLAWSKETGRSTVWQISLLL
jgi:2-polyprenyl-6-methoxyphenol hydroxylase-like FAD-dependent oxidoreductase